MVSGRPRSFVYLQWALDIISLWSIINKGNIKFIPKLVALKIITNWCPIIISYLSFLAAFSDYPPRVDGFYSRHIYPWKYYYVLRRYIMVLGLTLGSFAYQNWFQKILRKNWVELYPFNTKISWILPLVFMLCLINFQWNLFYPHIRQYVT